MGAEPGRLRNGGEIACVRPKKPARARKAPINDVLVRRLTDGFPKCPRKEACRKPQ